MVDLGNNGVFNDGNRVLVMWVLAQRVRLKFKDGRRSSTRIWIKRKVDSKHNSKVKGQANGTVRIAIRPGGT